MNSDNARETQMGFEGLPVSLGIARRWLDEAGFMCAYSMPTLEVVELFKRYYGE